MLSSPSSELMRAPALGSLDYQFYSGAGFHSLPLCPVVCVCVCVFHYSHKTTL